MQANKALNTANDQPAGGANRKIRILAVDDDQEAMKFLVRAIEAMGHDYVRAHNGREALDILHEQGGRIDVILLDRIMPLLDGMGVVRYIRNDPMLRRIPVIMQTSCNSPEDVREGIDAGVFYYLCKPYDLVVLRSVLDAAIRESQRTRNLHGRMLSQQAGFGMMHTGKFAFRTMQDAENLACFLANVFPDPNRVVTGLAELMFNAIEHGNLEIGFEGKRALLETGRWQAEVEKRLADPRFAGRVAEAALARKDGGVYVVITDQGKGFVWKNHIKIDPSRADSPHGRGIAHAGTVCFDRLTYNEQGNKVVAFVGEGDPMEW